MFRIGICEDDAAQREYLKNCIEKWAEKRQLPLLREPERISSGVNSLQNT